ncbi:MAG TPA: hypothetical protein VLI42_00795 [Chthoniobacterales bacterium]|jgi:hypothetical protein|nr:hypothetical protein [Chthoniobacterales bacterium]
MEAFVLVFLPARDAHRQTEQNQGVPGSDGIASSSFVHLGFESSRRRQSPTAFWTWFIPNPRGADVTETPA